MSPSSVGWPLFDIQRQTPGDILAYRVTDRASGQSIIVERTDEGGWQRQDAPAQQLNADAAEFGARVIYSFQLVELVRFDAETDLSQFGLAPQPQVVVSFRTFAYNDNNDRMIRDITLHIGSLSPTRQAYYAVQVDEVHGVRLGEWVYLIRSEYIDALLRLMADTLAVPTQAPQGSATETQTP
jgi:hypothetical protein